MWIFIRLLIAEEERPDEKVFLLFDLEKHIKYQTSIDMNKAYLRSVHLDLVCDNERVETLNKQLLINIFEILTEQGLLSEEEKNRVKVMVSNNN